MKSSVHKLTFLLLTLITTQIFAQNNPIIFVTQVPIPTDFTTIGSTFGNHKASMKRVGRGGDLWIKYVDGTLKNLTEAAGYGTTGFQGANAIAVRDPSVHWDGNKIVFSMIVGAPTERYQVNTFFWQLYEMSGLGKNETPVITKITNQPSNFNNISPIYGTDDKIIFTSDRPRNGQAHLYPQLDEYEMEATNTGLWKLDPSNGTLTLLNHAPSGNFTPIIDSFGRVIFTQWDHLQQDQMADTDRRRLASGQALRYGTFNFSSEEANATPLYNDRTEVFPEPRDSSIQISNFPNLEGHRFNHFFPWMINEDGTDIETLNHIGRHELHKYLPSTFNDDPNVREFYGQIPRVNQNSIRNMLQIKEHPLTAGRYFGIDAPTFRSHGAGQIIEMYAPPSQNPEQIVINYMTHKDTSDITNSPSANHSGLYRDPLVLSDDTLISAHTSETREDDNVGSRNNPQSLYDFRLKNIVFFNGNFVASTPLTSGIQKNINYWDPDQLVTYTGLLWEWQPVELRSRTRPIMRTSILASPEQQIFDQENVNINEFKNYLKEKNLSLVISRDVTIRDDLDQQQPSNLKVVGTNKQTLGASGKIYEIDHLQIFQADQLRAMREDDGDIDEGRRVIGQAMHEKNAISMNPNILGSPSGSVKIAKDGSVAAFVPAQRAISWQMTDPAHTPVVRERNWLTFQPGEIRTCPACHGVNEVSQSGSTQPVNPPQALTELLRFWKNSLSVPHDYNDDNRADLLWWNKQSNTVSMYEMDSNIIANVFTIANVPDANWKISGTGDFNGDGSSDIFWRHSSSGENRIYLMNGSNILENVHVDVETDQNWKVVETGDFNGDNKTDILWRHKTSGENRIYLLDGSTILSNVTLNSVPDINWQVAGVGDFNGDDKDDILWRNKQNGRVWMYLIDGTTISAGIHVAFTGLDWDIQDTGDFDADGKDDILWRNNVNGRVWEYLMNGSEISISSHLAFSDTNWEIESTGDYNGDGTTDIFWRNQNSGLNWMYLLRGTEIILNDRVNIEADLNWTIIK
ncbi:MAG: FG-GAP-like repeat-containing protein [Gammaproteobacteria bacterium]